MTTSDAAHSVRHRFEHGATSRLDTIANTACSSTAAPRLAPTSAKNPSSPSRYHSAATAATAPTPGAPSAASAPTSIRSLFRCVSNAATIRSS